MTNALHNPNVDDLFLIAESDAGEPLGFAYVVTTVDFFTEVRYAHVSEIAVARSGEGAGTVLMAAAETWARERGYPQLTLNTVETNEPARRFYMRTGFAPAYRQLYKRLTSG